MKSFTNKIAAALFVTNVDALHDIRDYGALTDDDSLNAERVNAQAFMDAIVAANMTMGTAAEGDREVLIPANCTFNMMPAYAEDLNDLTITVDGTVKASKRQHRWP